MVRRSSREKIGTIWHDTTLDVFKSNATQSARLSSLYSRIRIIAQNYTTSNRNQNALSQRNHNNHARSDTVSNTRIEIQNETLYRNCRCYLCVVFSWPFALSLQFQSLTHIAHRLRLHYRPPTFINYTNNHDIVNIYMQLTILI